MKANAVVQIIHRISINSTPEIQRELAAMGIFVEKGNPIASNLVTFEADEAHEAWPALRVWIAKRQASDYVTTKFSKEEIEAARWLEFGAWHHGYPQPNEDESGYLAATYDLTNYCEECGIGLKQKAPFQMKDEPKWGRRGILQLNWVFDEFFVRPDVWTNVFNMHGITCRQVTNTRGVVLKTVVQLLVEDEVCIVTEKLPGTRCPRCGEMKYLPVTKGPFPSLTTEPRTSMVKTKEYFGSGASANHAVLISQEIARALTAQKVHGASVRPVAEAMAGGN